MFSIGNILQGKRPEKIRFTKISKTPSSILFPWQELIYRRIVQSNSSIIVSVPPAAGKTRPILLGAKDLLLKHNFRYKILYSVPIQQLISNVLRDMKFEFGDEFFNKLRIGIKVAEGTPTASLTGLVPDKDTHIDIATYEYAAHLSKIFKYDLSIIDEFQEAVPLRYDPDRLSKASSYATILSNARRIILISGSLNRNALRDLSEAIKTYTNIRTIEILPSDTTVQDITNRSRLVVCGSGDVTNRNRLLKLIQTRILHRIGYTLVIIFSRFQIYTICEYLVKHLPKINDLDKLYPNRQFYYPNELENVDTNSIKIGNPFLRECIERGFAYIIGGTHKVEGELSGLDKQLTLLQDEKDMIADLFANKKIYILFATDAVGLGITLRVETLIIPSIKKFAGAGVGFTHLDPSSLVQVLHRAGRGHFPTAYIITSPDHVDHIKKALQQNPVLDIDEPNTVDLKRMLVLHSPRKMSFREKLYRIFSMT